MPLIIFPSNAFDPHLNRAPSSSGSPQLSAFRPESVHSFRHGLFHSPEALSSLRLEAVDRFLWWREIERGVESVLDGTSGYSAPSYHYSLQTPKVERGPTISSYPDTVPQDPKGKSRAFTTSPSFKWDQAQWQSKWESSLSTDVVKTLRRRNHDRRPRKLIERRSTVTAFQRPAVPSPPSRGLSSSSTTSRHRMTPQKETRRDQGYFPTPNKEHDDDTEKLKNENHALPGIPFDPLHLPSLFAFSWSLLTPLRLRLFSFLPFSNSTARSAQSGGNGFGVITLLSVFCAGAGLGYVLAGMQ